MGLRRDGGKESTGLARSISAHYLINGCIMYNVMTQIIAYTRIYMYDAYTKHMTLPAWVGKELPVGCWAIQHTTRDGQNHIHTVLFWQEDHQRYGHTRCIHTVPVNPTHNTLHQLDRGRRRHREAAVHCCLTVTQTHYLASYIRVCRFS